MSRLRDFLFTLLAIVVLAVPAHAQFFGLGSAGQIIVGQSPPIAAWKTLNGDCTLSATGLIVCTKVNGIPTYTGLPAPVNAGDATNKQYVDSSVIGVVAHEQVRLATAAALPGNIYDNGAGGVGATLTANSNGTLSIDGVVTSGSDRVLIKNEAATPNNGIYVVTSAGDAGTKYILTRSADADTVGNFDPNKIGIGSFVLATAGNTQANSGWTVNTNIVTISVSPIIWVQFAGETGVSSLGGMVGTLSCGTGLTCAGTTIAGPAPFPQGRLTLQSATPVMTTTQASKTTLYYDCFHGGNVVPVFNGTFDVTLTIGACQISTAMASTGTGVLTGGHVFDAWAINVSGTLTLCVATDGAGNGWGGDTSGTLTSRGTGYSAIDTTTRAYVTNTNPLTHCYNGATDRGPIAANRATYLGTIYTSGNGLVTWQYGTFAAVPGLFGVWNAYNRVSVAGNVWAAAATFNITSTPAPPNGEQVNHKWVTGISEDVVLGDISATMQPFAPVGTTCSAGFGIDVNNSFTTGPMAASFTNAASATNAVSTHYSGYPGVGLHTLYGILASDTQPCQGRGGALGVLRINLRM